MNDRKPQPHQVHTKQKQKYFLTKPSSFQQVVIHGIECNDDIFLCYFNTVAYPDSSFYLCPLMQAWNAYLQDPHSPLYPEDAIKKGNIADILHIVDNCYPWRSKVYVGSTGSTRNVAMPNRPGSNFNWMCCLWSKTDDGSIESTWTLMDWVKNIKVQFREFIAWTMNHPDIYTKWRYPIMIRCVSDNPDRCILPLVVELLGEDVIHVIVNNYASIMGSEDLLRDDELVLKYFGPVDKAVLKERIENVMFPAIHE